MLHNTDVSTVTTAARKLVHDCVEDDRRIILTSLKHFKEDDESLDAAIRWLSARINTTNA